LNVAIAASLVLHASVLAVAGYRLHKPPPPPMPLVYEVSFIAPTPPEPEPEPVKPPPPPPPPKKEEPKPEPEKKPEPKKEEPKKVAEKKPEPKKEPEKKPEPKKEPEKKPEPPKPQPPKELPQPEVVAKAPPQETGVKRDMLPPVLNAWGRQVQRKVEKFWVQPGGVRLDGDESSVQISFWVGRDGMLLTQPVVESRNANPALANSGVQAVINSQPLPPLPVEFAEDRAHVYYTFSMMNVVEPTGGTL
jgi:outer membrane biosynthesis protein TonB